MSTGATVSFIPAFEALEKARSFKGPLIVDLDETLYLANSTEDFIDLARPYILAAYLLRILDFIKPWRFTHHSTRDNWRVLMIRIFFPWTIGRWKAFCKIAHPSRFNQELLATLGAHTWPVIIATNGYEKLVRPLLSGTIAQEFTLISCGLTKFSDRSGGKAALVQSRIGMDIVSTSAVVTDSIDDLDLLVLCEMPLLTTWEGINRVRKPRDFAYFPVDYLHRVKQPNARVWRILLKEDVIPWALICMSAVVITPISFIASLILFGSLWAVYEAGYYDNDKCAVRFENDPKVKQEFLWFSNPYLEFYCWAWGIALGAAASVLLHTANPLMYFAAWMGMLLLCRATYYVYNRIDKNSRVVLYPVLQAFRFGAPIVMLGVNAVGAAVIISQIVPRWYEYSLYRYIRSAHNQTDWPKTNTRTFRLITFCLLLSGIAISQGITALLTPATAVFGLFLFSAMKEEIPSIIRGWSRIDRQVRS